MASGDDEGTFADAVAALRAAQSADKLYKAGDREQGLIAAASYRTGCEIFARIVDDVDTDENARAAIRPKIAQIRSRLKKLEAAIPEAAASAMRQAGVQKETDAATLIQARVRGRSARRLAQKSATEDYERKPERIPEPEPEPEPEPVLPTTYSGHDRRPSSPRRVRDDRAADGPRLQPREYLDVHVYPHLQPALQACERLRPVDALGFLAECLLDPEFLLKAAHAPRQVVGDNGGLVKGFFVAGSEEKRRLNAALVELNKTRPADPIGRLADLFIHHRDEMLSIEAASTSTHIDDDPYEHRYETSSGSSNSSNGSRSNSPVPVDDDRE